MKKRSVKESGVEEFWTLGEAEEFAKKKERQGYSVKIVKRGDWIREFPLAKQYVVRWEEVVSVSGFSKWVCPDCETVFYIPVTIEPKFCPCCGTTKIECCCEDEMNV